MKVPCEKCKKQNHFTHVFCKNCGNEMPVTELKEKSGFQLFCIYVWNMIKAIWKGILDNLYLIFLASAIAYFIFYKVVANNQNYLSSWTYKDETLEVLKTVAFIIFSAGIFTSSLKYLQYIKVFEKEFDRVLSSKKYLKQVKESVESITLSKKFLLKQTNLEKIWQDVTLCMYQKEFPELFEKLKSNLNNELFKQNNISYYYKHQIVEYNITIVSEWVIQLEQSITYTLIRPSEKLFNWNFGAVCLKSDSDNEIYPKIEVEFLSGKFKFDSNVDVIVDKEKDPQLLYKFVNKDLSGSKEYLIKMKMTQLQNIKDDRFWTFGSDRIIDDLDVRIQFPKELDVVFTESTKDREFVKIETNDLNKKYYMNRGLLLPGEKFKIFFLKK